MDTTTQKRGSGAPQLRLEQISCYYEQVTVWTSTIDVGRAMTGATASRTVP